MECREKLIRLRKKQGLTQLELAEAVNVSRQAISKWEVGIATPSIENLRSLSTFYGVPVDLLLNDELDLPDAKQVLPEEPSQQSEASPVEESPLGNEIKKEIKSLKKWMIALVAVFVAFVLVVAVYIVGTLQEGSDAIPIDESSDLALRCSGHADVKELKEIIAGFEPKILAPVHTLHPELEENPFGERVLPKRGEIFTLS